MNPAFSGFNARNCPRAGSVVLRKRFGIGADGAGGSVDEPDRKVTADGRSK
jgi:hypothetical protein